MASLYQAVAGINKLELLAMADSTIHRLHPMSKLLTTVVYIVIVVSFPTDNLSGLVPLIFYPVILMSLSGTPYLPLFNRLLIAMPFALLGGLSNIIILRETAFQVGNLSVSVGVISFLSIMLKTMLTVFAVLILTATTSLIEISNQLTTLRVPKILSLQFVMTYRYLSVLLSEVSSMLTAYSLRAPKQKGIKMEDTGSFLGFLIIRSFDRAERVYRAMKCRGFQNVYHCKQSAKLCLSNWLYIFIVSSMIIGLRFVNLSMILGALIC